MNISRDAVYLVDITAGDAECSVMIADSLLIRRIEQAVHLALSVVVQLDLTDAELVRPSVPRVVCDLRDGLLGQLQVRVVIHETWHRKLLIIG